MERGEGEWKKWEYEGVRREVNRERGVMAIECDIQMQSHTSSQPVQLEQSPCTQACLQACPT